MTRALFLLLLSVGCSSSAEATRADPSCGDASTEVAEDTDIAIDTSPLDTAVDVVDTAPPPRQCSAYVPPRAPGYCDLVVRIDQTSHAILGWRELCEETDWKESWPLESIGLVAQAFTHRDAPLATNTTVQATTLFSQGPGDDDDFALVDGDLGAFLLGGTGASLVWSDWRPPFPEDACRPSYGIHVLVREIVRPGASPTDSATIVTIGNLALDNPLGVYRYDDSRCGPRISDVEVFRWGTREWIVIAHPGGQCFDGD